MSDKQEEILTLINTLATKYVGITDEDIEKAIHRYMNDNRSIDIISNELIEIANITSKEALRKEAEKMQEEPREKFDFNDIVNALDTILNTSEGNKLIVAGGCVPYILMDEDSNRLHDDIDLICKEENISDVRSAFQKLGMYKSDWDSRKHTDDDKDYGFEFEIDGLPIGVYPYSVVEEGIVQRSFDPYTKECKTSLFPNMKEEDFVKPYKSRDGRIYKTLSLEVLARTKMEVNREKDMHDLSVIKHCSGFNPDKAIEMELPIRDWGKNSEVVEEVHGKARNGFSTSYICTLGVIVSSLIALTLYLITK